MSPTHTTPMPGADDLVVDPQVGECVLCFVHRAVTELGCDTTLRWTTRFHEVRVPEATSLQRRMGDLGGSCDCGIFDGGFELVRECLERDVHTDELHQPALRPTCGGVRRTSARPCRNWQRVRRRGAEGASPHTT